MKKIIYILSVVSISIGISSCQKDYLERKNLTEMDQSLYYSTPEQMSQAMNGVYSQLQSDKGNENAVLVSDILSDDCFAGGGPGDVAAKDIDNFEINHITGLYDELWKSTYTGIYRTNNIIANIEKPKWNNDDQKNQIYGEALFMRALYNLRLGEMWGQAPLITDLSVDPNQPKSNGDQIFAQIATDLKKAIEIMPSNTYSSIPSGHATKWAAEALMARSFLFYTGYYNKTTMPLVDGGEITKPQVVDWLTDLIDNSGHKLASDFRNIWSYSNNKDYKWAQDNNLSWIGESEENTETIFAIKFSPFAAFGHTKYSNRLQLFVGPRGNPGNNQFGKGWGWATVNSQLWDSFEDNDTRKTGSIIDATDKINEAPFSTKFEFGRNNSEEETGFFNKKYLPVLSKNEDGKWKGMYYLMFGGQDNFSLWNMADQILIRYSDVLLMAAELESPKAQEYFNEVRSRAGLAPKTVSLEAIKEERRHELAFEGLRYFDLMRWHEVDKAFDKVKDIPVKNQGKDGIYNSATYRPETGGFLPIPNVEISLSGGVLVQNPGW